MISTLRAEVRGEWLTESFHVRKKGPRSAFHATRIPQRNSVDVEEQLKAPVSDFLFRIPGMSDATMARRHRGRDITNLSPPFFSVLFFPPASRYRSPLKNFLSFGGTELLGFQLFKKRHEEEDEGEKAQGFFSFSHVAPLTRALEIPGLSPKITLFSPLFLCFNHLSSAESPGVAGDQNQSER